jgi:DNA-binding response OmpR family regulator
MVLAFQAVDRILAFAPETKRARRDILPFFRACLSLGLVLERLSQLNQAAAAGFPVIVGLEVDEANRQVMVDGRMAELTPMYFNVIHHLWQKPGQLCSRGELFETIYNESYEQGKAGNSDDPLNMLIRRVRQRIELDTRNPRYLITIPGEGFILYPQGKP